jgi:glycosyltransferase involved in cell wall biosynthesis
MGHKIAVCDYKIIPTNPIGGCHRRLLQGLCHEHDFTVFAVECENPCPERIRFVRIPAIPRPLAVLFVSYHLLVPLYYWAYCLRFKTRFDLVQIVESNLSFGDVSYAQFCHRAYLRAHWRETRPSGLLGVLRWINHRLHALVEPWIYRRVRRIVVPSEGLVRELLGEYPSTAGKVDLLPNPVDIERMAQPETFDRDDFRRRLGAAPEDLVLAFVALGHFERKGLPPLLEGLCRLRDPRLKLVIVGGEPDLLTAYRARVERMGMQEQVLFVGPQRDVRPYLWAADAFALPSFYEVFPLVSLEAAAAGLPLIVTPLYGAEEFIRDGENGILVERTAEGVARGLACSMNLPLNRRYAMGAQAQADVRRYATEHFLEARRAFYGPKPVD